MPRLITVTAMLWLIAAGAAADVALLTLAAVRQAFRNLADRRQAQLDRQFRPQVLRVVKTKQIPAELIRAGGRRGRATDRVVWQYLAQIRGEAHGLLAEILQRRGTAARTLRAASRRNASARCRAAYRLGLIASADAVWRLERLLRDDRSQRVRIVAAEALGDAGSPGAAAALLRAVDTTLAGVPEGVAASALLALGTAAVPALRHAARGPGGGARRALAVDLLGMLKDLPAWQIAADAARSPDPRVRLSAARALGQLGMRQATPTLVGCLAPAEEPEVRAMAAWALGRVRDPGSAIALKGSLTDQVYEVAHNAAQALAGLRATGNKVLQQMATGEGAAAAHAREALARQPAEQPGLRPPAVQPPALGPAHPPAVRQAGGGR